MDSEQKRIFLWGSPRALTTAFLRCMISRESCKWFHEPWSATFYVSANRQSDRFSKEDVPDRPGTTFKERKAMMEAEYSGFKEVFVKDHTFKVKKYLDSGTLDKVVPEGYTHTFIIRHPRKVIRSYYYGIEKGYSGFEGFQPLETSFEETFKMHEYVTQKLKQKSVIVNADDLQRDPEMILRLYCQAVGIDFQDSMINWPPLTAEQCEAFQEYEQWHKLVKDSSGILPKTPSELPEVDSLPEIVQQAIQDAIPFYEQLHAKRLQPGK